MKYIHKLSYIWLLFLLIGCSEDSKQIEGGLTLSLDNRLFIATYGSVEVKLVSDVEAVEDIEIPFTISANSAVESVEYSISDHKFLLKAGTKEASIVITPLEVETDKSLLLKLDDLPDVNYGLFKEARIFLGRKSNVVYSFTKSSLLLSSNKSISMSLLTPEGNIFKVQDILKIPLEVDLEKSTAEEGVHFNIPDKNIVIPANKNIGSCLIEWVSYEEGKNTLVLKSLNPFSFIEGEYGEITITIARASMSLLVGDWKYIGPPDWNYDWWSFNGGWFIDISGFPKANEDDRMTITEDYLVIPQFTSDLKDFFIGETNLTYSGQIEEVFQELREGLRPYREIIDVFEADHVNVSYDSKQTTIRPAKIKYRFPEEGKGNVLELTLGDFEPTGYFAPIYEMMGSMEDFPVRFHFTRIEDDVQEK